jgi:hypothetical protein
MTVMTLNGTMLAIALENTKPGTMMAAAKVDPDGTARIELLERLDVGWRNVTLEGATTTSIDMAHEFDDLVVTALPAETETPTADEWEYGVSPGHDSHVMRRRKAGEWLPVDDKEAE